MTLILAVALLTAERDLIAVTQALFDAIGEGNAALWDRALLPDATIIDEFGRKQDKAEAVKGIHPFPKGFSGSIEVRDAKVRIHGDAAVVDCELYEKESVFDQKLVVRYLAMNTFIKTGGSWKLLGMMTVTLPTQPPLLPVSGLSLADYPGTYRYGPDRAYQVQLDGDKLSYTTRAGRKPIALQPLAKDVFMEAGDERNIVIFRRDDSGKVESLIERRKFNDLIMKRE